MASNLSNIYGALPVSIDPTFNFGAQEVTPLTYRHPPVEAKSKNVPGQWTDMLLIGPIILHHQKNKEVFDCEVSAMARKTCLQEAKIGIITDEESALIKACKRNFTKATHLRCMNHFKENYESHLKSIGITIESEQESILAVVFGKEGLVESNDKIDQRNRLTEERERMLEIEKQFLKESYVEKKSFYSYIKEREKSVLRKILRNARRDGGMKEESADVPYRVYTNQSETVNSILSPKKQSIGRGKKEDVPKSCFIKDIWQSIISTQDEEIQKAIYGQSERYRLKEEAKYLQVSIEEWYNWTFEKRKR